MGAAGAPVPGECGAIGAGPDAVGAPAPGGGVGIEAGSGDAMAIDADVIVAGLFAAAAIKAGELVNAFKTAGLKAGVVANAGLVAGITGPFAKSRILGLDKLPGTGATAPKSIPGKGVKSGGSNSGTGGLGPSGGNEGIGGSGMLGS